MLARLTALLALATLPARAEPLQIVTDIAPVHSLVAQVTGDLARATSLLPPGASPHDYALRPSDARHLAEAGLIVEVGPALTPWLEDTARTLAAGSPRLTLLEVPGTTTRQGPAEHGGIDPHAWLSPDNAALWLTAIAGQLGRIDPANAGTYRDNADAAAARLQETRTQIAARLAPVADTPFVIQHDSLGYFADAFGLALAGAISDSDDDAPSAAHLAALRTEIADKGVPCLFTEVGETTRQSESIASDTGIKLAELDPLGARLTPGPSLYPELLSALADDMAACLGRD